MTHDELWSQTKIFLKKELTINAFNTWFEPVSPIGINDTELILEVPNQFFFEWIESHYKNSIEKTIEDLFGLNLTVKYTVSPGSLDFKPDVWMENKIEPPVNLYRKPAPLLNLRYTFSTFIEGINNQFAKAAASNVAESPGKQSFNPLVVYGGVGLGKTHLLHAIGNHILQTRPELNVITASSEKFTQDFISSIQKNKTIEFSKIYRQADVLLIDDIQFFQRKEQTQEQFFHTFNELYQQGKQIVLTADRYPGEMTGLQDRLLSRFKSGLAVDIQPPDFETRVAILLDKAEQNGLDLPYDIVEFIATHVNVNIRELESTIIRLLAHSSLSNCEIDMSLVKKVIRERMGSKIFFNLTIEDIVNKVSGVAKITENDMIGISRKKQFVEARQVAMYLCRETLSASFSNIGLYFGGRDHTTVLHACRMIEKKLQIDDRIKNMVKAVRKEINVNFE